MPWSITSSPARAPLKAPPAWETYPMLRRTCSDSFTTSYPATVAWPAVGVRTSSASAVSWSCRRHSGPGSRPPHLQPRRGRRRRPLGPQPSGAPAGCGRSAPDLVHELLNGPLSRIHDGSAPVETRAPTRTHRWNSPVIPRVADQHAPTATQAHPAVRGLALYGISLAFVLRAGLGLAP